MILDIVQTIINYGKLENQIKLSQINKHMYGSLYVLSVWSDKVNQQIIEKRIFSKLKKLKCGGNKKIRNVNHLKNTLKILHCQEYCGIDQNGISELQFIEHLDCNFNSKINNVNHLKNTLKVLKCGGNSCGVNQDGISELEYVEELDCSNNDKDRKSVV